MKVCVVGGVAGGASAAARIRRIDASAQIIMFERGEHVSFSNCCLPYHLSGTVQDSQKLVLMTPKDFKEQHNIEVRNHAEVLSIDREKHSILVKNLENGEQYEESYDKLILSPGADPVKPRSIEGIEKTYTVRNVEDIRNLKKAAEGVNKVAVIGGGFIGLEVAENLVMAGKQVALIEAADQVMAPLDHDMVQMLHKELLDNHVELYLSSAAARITDTEVVIRQGSEEKSVPAELIVCAIGVRPCTKLAQEACLEIGKTGGIQVNEHYQTSDPDIYAVGDAIESVNALTGENGRLALAGPAQRQARAAANHIYHLESHNQNSFIGSNCIRLFGMNAASTGLNERAAEKAGLHYDSVTLFPNDKVILMPDSNYMGFKLVFEVPTGKILGAQAVGRGDVTKRIDVIAAMITKESYVWELEELELCYSPVFDTAKDVVNLAGFVAENILTGVYKQVHLCEVRALTEKNAYIIDVREQNEYDQGHLLTAHNIPLTQLRERLDEIPRDIPVYLHCRSSQRSYYALCELKNRGFDNIINISGSYLGICLYEYAQDVLQGREPILTAYNFT